MAQPNRVVTLQTISDEQLTQLFLLLIESRDMAEDVDEDDLRDRIDDQLDVLESYYPFLQKVDVP